MCVNSKYVTNRYTGKRILVSCGRCPACVQERAARRATRIRNHNRKGYVFLFVTLTYAPDFLPFVYKSDLQVTDRYINIYRRAHIRHYRNKVIKDTGIRPIDSVFLADDALLSSYGVKSPVGSPSDVVSIIYYKDVKDFFKRLRINLLRNYGYSKYISYFSCSEYGAITFRAHHHLLLQCPLSDVETLSAAIVESWAYADRARTKKYIEIAKDAASYVSSYVNSGNSLPEILTSRAFRQKHSFSKGFGMGLQSFSLDSVLQMHERGDFSYNVVKIEHDVPTVVDIPLPEYVINRYFPKIRGNFLLSPDEVRKLLSIPRRFAAVVSERGKLVDLSYDDDDIHRLSVRLSNVYSRYFTGIYKTFDLFLEEYPSLYVSVWSRYRSYLLRITYERVYVEVGIENFYENPQDAFERFTFFRNKDGSLSVCVLPPLVRSDLPKDRNYVINPNLRKDICEKTLKFGELFHKMDKSRKITNSVWSHYEYV